VHTKESSAQTFAIRQDTYARSEIPFPCITGSAPILALTETLEIRID
jgi:hypothetical protein